MRSRFRAQFPRRPDPQGGTPPSGLLSTDRGTAHPPTQQESGPTSSSESSRSRHELPGGAVRQACGSSWESQLSSRSQNYRVLIRISCDAGSGLLASIQTFVGAYVNARYRTKPAERVRVVTCELLDNAVNYGSIRGDVVYELAESPDNLQVRVSNEAVDARVAMLRERLRRLAQSAETVFMEEMSRSVQGGIPKAMLGLARVCHEAAMKVELSIEGRRVTISATCPR